MYRFITAVVTCIVCADMAFGQVSADDRQDVEKTMAEGTKKLPERQQRALKEITERGGFRGNNEKLSSVTADEFASVFKAMGILSGSTKQPAWEKIGRQIIVTEGDERAKIIRGYHLAEQAVLLSKKNGFRLSDFSKEEQQLIMKSLDHIGDDLLFAGLTYAERASAIKKMLQGK